MGQLRAIKSVTVEGFKITLNTPYDVIKTKSEAVQLAYHLLRRDIYPTAFLMVFKHSHPNVEIKLEHNNHKKYQAIRRSIPFAFDEVGDEDYTAKVRRLFHLDVI